MTPLTPAVFHILLSLSDGEKHGYGIMQEISVRTRNKVQMGPGTLYGTIRRMLEAGLIEECESRVDPKHGDERRRYYRLTSEGRRATTVEARRMEDLVELARSKRLLRRGPQQA